MKNIRVFLSENFQFLEVQFSIYLNRRVFVMAGQTVYSTSKYQRHRPISLHKSGLSESLLSAYTMYQEDIFTISKNIEYHFVLYISDTGV